VGPPTRWPWSRPTTMPYCCLTRCQLCRSTGEPTPWSGADQGHRAVLWCRRWRAGCRRRDRREVTPVVTSRATSPSSLHVKPSPWTTRGRIDDEPRRRPPLLLLADCFAAAVVCAVAVFCHVAAVCVCLFHFLLVGDARAILYNL